jgi:hypothetical protein
MSTDFVKQTLRENLARTLVPHVADGLWSIYESAKTACERNRQVDQTLKTFQNLLTRIPDWKEDVLHKEVERIVKASKCDYIEDLLLGVFIGYIRAFAALQQVESTHVEIPFERPELAVFVHRFYKQSARESWSNAYLFKTIGVDTTQQARNRRDIETMLGACLNETVDSFIPWKDISKAYFKARTETPAPPPSPVLAAALPAVRPDTPMPTEPAKVSFGENETEEFEADDEEEEQNPPISLGEDIKLDLEEEEEDDDITKKVSGEMVLNL